MPAINENLTWDDVGAISTGPGTFVRDAFRGKTAEKVLLPKGFRMYKFADYQGLTRDDRMFLKIFAGSAPGGRPTKSTNMTPDIW